METATWDIEAVDDDGVATTSVTVAGAALGGVYTAKLDKPLPPGVILAAEVVAAGVVGVTLINRSGGRIDLPSATLTVNAASASAAYTKYVALLSQTAGQNPTAVVLENDTGLTFDWTRNVHPYYPTVVNFFAVMGANYTQRCVVIVPSPITGASQNYDAIRRFVAIVTADSIILETRDAAFALAEGYLENTPIEVRIYPTS